MKLNFTTIFILLIAIKFSSSTTVKCDFSIHHTNLGPLLHPYQCTASVEPSRAAVTVDNVVGGHQERKTDDDVILINIKSIKSSRIPPGFDIYFRNVEGIFAFSSDKTELLKEDLMNFPKLRYLDMSTNRLRNLPSDVFEDNLQMEWIDLSENRIKYVGLDILEPLKKLHYANFGSNICIDELARDKSDIERTLKKNLVRNCQPFGQEYTGTTYSPYKKVQKDLNQMKFATDASAVTTTTTPETTTAAKGFFQKIFG
ncbi:hypothetical protein PVAND_016089 [Polypedilum vanderplanki]|uniref:Uncharacterized protein n=1 Tax=Polypedilum vanderplanki TaxID=319348 RepID=A0A9J6BE33_POLVA|nr:hypothetical protein PVAND_016089 [Polypedilum vanderplanki]